MPTSTHEPTLHPMTIPAPQPTILVKKADGTTVRMTLAEVKKLKEQAAAQQKKVDDAKESINS